MGKRRSDEDQWRESIREQLETELDRRVREALESPPHCSRAPLLSTLHGEGAVAAGAGKSMAQLEQLNAHIQLDLTEREQEYMRTKRWKVLQAKRKIRRMMSQNTMEFAEAYKTEVNVNPDYLIGHMSYEPESEGDYAGLFGFEGISGAKTQAHYASVVKKALTNFGALTTAERHEFFYAFTRNGFREAMRTGKLPDGSDLIHCGNGKYKDKHGIIRDEHGPFWPPDHGPLFPAPVFSTDSLPFEPMTDEDSNKKQPSVESQDTPYTNKWRGIQIVYDSEKSAKQCSPPPVSEGHCPSLLFESRFESANLRQARRIGEFDYELVLRTDLYTTRHTQWYYFRVKNALPGVTYRFKLVNLLKRDSLYNHGMRPILYSEKDAQEKGTGWKRAGHHITYARNLTNLNCPLLSRDRTHFMLEWQMEFPNADDTCYLAHCYPYSYTDLKDDLDDLLADPARSAVMRREVLCETKAGNSCFLVTVTNFDQNEDTQCSKKAVIVSARVHPGESNASWMMKGMLDFITASSPTAHELRDKFVFKIVPMLNPDGVIVGNYRCSLAARDLNRNYRHPRKEGFPTVWHIKNMMQITSETNEILIYCDLHGHSRKQNVFMYGCNTPPAGWKVQPGASPPFLTQHYLKERLFPWLMSQKAPDKFSFHRCKFQIKRCKESTGRVVMFRQLKVRNSFTMEASFCGTTICRGERRHFNPADLESMGHTFCQSVLEYSNMLEDKSRESEVVLDLTRAITQQVLETRGLLPHTLPDITTEKGRDQLKAICNDTKLSTSEQFTTAFMKLVRSEYQKELKGQGQRSAPEASRRLQEDKHPRRECTTLDLAKLDINKLLDTMSGQTIDGCVSLLEQLDVSSSVCESDSSDSDSESEPEVKHSNPKPRKKKKSKKKRGSQHDMQNDDKKKSPEKDEQRPSSTSALPAISNDESQQKKKKNQTQDMKKYVKNFKNYPGFVNKYEGRSNGGIPCFSEERLNERAAKRMAELKKREDEKDMPLAEYSNMGGFVATEDDYHHVQAAPPALRGQYMRSLTQADLRSHLQHSLQTTNLHQGFQTANLQHSFQTTMPPYIRTGYMHAAKIGTIAEVSDNSSDSDWEDENPQRVPMAAMHSPYQHPGHGMQGAGPRHSMQGAGLSHSAGAAQTLTPTRVGRLPTLNHQLPAASLTLDTSCVSVRPAAAAAPAAMVATVANPPDARSPATGTASTGQRRGPRETGGAGAVREQAHEMRMGKGKILAPKLEPTRVCLESSRAEETKEERGHPIMSREYTDLLLQRLRSHKHSLVSVPSQHSRKGEGMVRL